MELSRHPKKSTEQLAAIDSWYQREAETIMTSETLVPSAKRGCLEELRREYRDSWFQAKQAADRDLEEWSEIFQSRAESAAETKLPQVRDARILKALELQRLHNRIERNRDQPGRLLAAYEQAVRASDHVVAHELEDVLPELLPGDARADFERRAKENRLARMSEEDRKKLAEHRAFERERSSVEQGLGLQERNRQRGYSPTPTTLATSYPAGRPPQTDEVPNPMWRDPALEQPTNEPAGGTIVPHPSEGGAA